MGIKLNTSFFWDSVSFFIISNYSVLRYNKMPKPKISNNEIKTSIPPRPPNPNPKVSWNTESLEETNKETIAFRKKNDCISKGIKKNNNPTIYLELLVRNILI